MSKVLLLALIGGGALVAINLPDIKRYLKIRAM
jgi:hypothetical protein